MSDCGSANKIDWEAPVDTLMCDAGRLGMEGEMALLSDEPRSATVHSVTACQLYELSKQDVDSLCEVCNGVK